MKRLYAEFENRLNALNHPGLDRAVIGTVQNYNIYRLLIGDAERRTLLLSGGMHGDEPAGVEAVLRFLEGDLTPVLSQFRLFVLPCINPWGYVHNSRENADKRDINRAFEHDNVYEARVIKKALSGYRFCFHLDLHEDYDATGTYFFEGRKDEHWVVPDISEHTKAIGPFDTHEDESLDDLPVAPSVYRVDPAWGLKGLITYTLYHHTDHVVMPETASSWDMDRRVAIHLLVLDKLLSHYQA